VTISRRRIPEKGEYCSEDSENAYHGVEDEEIEVCIGAGPWIVSGILPGDG